MAILFLIQVCLHTLVFVLLIATCESSRGEVELLINDGLLSVRVGSEQMNRDSVADGCDAVGESIHQYAVTASVPLTFADEMFHCNVPRPGC